MHTREQVARQAAHMSETMHAFLRSSRSGWVAIRLDDGGSDGAIYPDRASAEGDQREPCLVLQLPEPVRMYGPPPVPVTHNECADHLRFMAELLATHPTHTPVTLQDGGGLLGLPNDGSYYRALFRKIHRQPGRQDMRSTVVSGEMYRDLTTHLVGEGRLASTDGRIVRLSIRERHQPPIEITYTRCDTTEAD
ncbi:MULTISPECIES: hypothetical protein [unclassified Streptomyces]|uniref:Uncharacterized protein n=1 Tax=Streptomyces sp. F12 TaxID=1436084 RepID=V9Z9L0_9ACTN|nr:hypothetical protein [Streptomyces sp. F12]AHE40111.1 hypothetical protein pFRL6_24c [Streptomyces sp. F12]